MFLRQFCMKRITKEKYIIFIFYSPQQCTFNQFNSPLQFDYFLVALVKILSLQILSILYFYFSFIFIHLQLRNSCQNMHNEDHKNYPNKNQQTQKPSMSLGQRLQYFQKHHSSTPYIYAIVGNICYVIMQFNIKFSSQYFPPFYVLILRASLLLMVNTVIIHYSNLTVDIREQQKFRTLLKSSIPGALTVTIFLGSLKYVPAGSANALFNTAPIITCFIQALMYKKSLNIKHFLLTVVSFIGILFVIQPQFLFGQSSDKNSYLLLLSLVAAFTNSLCMIYLHNLKGKLHSNVVLQHFYIGQCLCNSLVMTFESDTMIITEIDFKVLLSLACMIFFGFFAQNGIVRAMMLKKPSYILPFGYITIICVAFIDFFVFGLHFGWLNIFGMILTSCGLFIKLIIPEQDKPITKMNQNEKQAEYIQQEEDINPF